MADRELLDHSFTISQQPLEILLVEDVEGHVRLTKDLLKECKIPHHLSAVGDGAEAVAFLRRTGKYAGAVRPDLIFLDLGLPHKSGHEVLASIKADPDLRPIPVIVLTSSQVEQDRLRSHQLQVNFYLTKPLTREKLLRVLTRIEMYRQAIQKLLD